MKKLKKIAALTLAAACAATVCAGAAFTDQSDIKVDSKVIDTLVEKNVIKGYENGSFQPNETVSRAEMAKMIYVLRTNGGTDAATYAEKMSTDFNDVNNHWASGYIKYCYAYGIVAGKSSTVFAPDAPVTTVEAAKMLLVYSGVDAAQGGLTGAQWKANTMKLAIEYLEPMLERSNTEAMATIVVATVEGDIHDIGKNLVVLMLKNYGYHVIDLGKDVPADVIVDTAMNEGAKVIGLSALMTTTMMRMKDVVELAKEKGCTAKIVIGGAAITESFSDEIGADGYSKDAAECVKLVERLLA